MLGHAAGSVTGRYVHIDEAILTAVERVSAEIAVLLDGDAPGQMATARIFDFSAPAIAGSFIAPAGTVTIRKAS